MSLSTNSISNGPAGSKLPSISDAVTVRALLAAIPIGSAICFANMYFGLQTGLVNTMPMQAALLGVAVLRVLRPYLSSALAPPEVTFIDAVASSLGALPFTAGFTGFFPAIEYLASEEEGVSIISPFSKVLLWAVGICLLGPVIAAPLRRYFLLREQLHFPSATATGILLGVLFNDKSVTQRANNCPYNTNSTPCRDHSHLRSINDVSIETARLASQNRNDNEHLSIERTQKGGIRFLLTAFAASFATSLATYFVPILRNLPIFGSQIAKSWAWTFNVSPGYFGFGMIVKPSTNAHLFLGTIVGWAILSPLAKLNGWAPGAVRDWDTGSQGWIIWVGIGLVVGDSIVELSSMVLEPLAARLFSYLATPRIDNALGGGLDERVSLLNPSALFSARRTDQMQPWEHLDDPWRSCSLYTKSMALWLSPIAFIICSASILVVFDGNAPISAIVVTFVLVPIACAISIRSLGQVESANTLAISRISQLILRPLITAQSASHVIYNIAIGGVVEAGAWQASQQMALLKTAYMTKTPPRAIFYGHIIGSLSGAIVSIFVYRLYTSVEKIPSDKFTVPDGHMWLITARLIYQRGLPPMAFAFAIGTIVTGILLGVLRIIGRNQSWQHLVPSGIALALGMYVPPGLTLPRVLGSLMFYICQKQAWFSELSLLCCASGLILGQGIFSIVEMLLVALKVPHL
ncbi:OPT superfamily oligopeptide transporter [Viridothelium virens]|uniref:OPT superfamily oligopeptide transporter n=1 Tax=Viridothelium virens TaxID=1048519 RepID=A0A6A6HLF9_VIRVR|nr:OPT superfamily oligopeptide transporter [Viridothelium virens]